MTYAGDPQITTPWRRLKTIASYSMPVDADDGTRVDVTSRGIHFPGFDFGRYSGDLRVLFDVVRAEIARRKGTASDPTR